MHCRVCVCVCVCLMCDCNEKWKLDCGQKWMWVGVTKWELNLPDLNWWSSNVCCTFQCVLIIWGTGCNVPQALHVSRWLVVMLGRNAFIFLGSQTLVCFHGNIRWVLLQLSWRIAVVFHRAIASERWNVLNNITNNMLKFNSQFYNSLMWNVYPYSSTLTPPTQGHV